MNNTQRLFQGMGVAMATPFRPDQAIDYTSLRRLVNHIVDGGADFLVVHGTTGESPCLTREERIEVITFVKQEVQGRIPIMLGLGGNNTQEVSERLRQLDPTGLSGILSVVPYYNKPTQEGIYQHFAHLARCSPLPIILYNVPGRVGVNMMPETVARLAELDQIIGVKEASGFVAQAEAISKQVDRADFSILSGDDNISIDFIRNGACGVISVVGNAYPRLFTQLIHLSMEGKYNEAEMIQLELRDLNTYLFAHGNPGGIKALLYQQGVIDHNVLRLPLVPVGQEVYEHLNEARLSVDRYIQAQHER